MVRISILAYVSMGLAAFITLLAFNLNPDPSIMLMLLPMFLILAGIPYLMNFLNRSYVEGLDLSHVKSSKIKDAIKKGVGDQVRVSGTVHSISNKWLNRPHFQIIDDTGEIGVLMFVAPRDDISCGDRIETIGTLRWSFGLRKKDKQIWGLRMEKVPSQ